MEKNKTVFFTGHRNLPTDRRAEILSRLYSTVGRLIADGYTSFICGGAVGFDTEAALCVLSFRRRFPQIELVLALPCRDQTQKWKDLDALTRYKSILGMADSVEYMQPFYTDGCMHVRNRWMADRSSVCVSYLTSLRGGTAYTCKYARGLGLRIINIASDSNT